MVNLTLKSGSFVITVYTTACSFVFSHCTITLYHYNLLIAATNAMMFCSLIFLLIAAKATFHSFLSLYLPWDLGLLQSLYIHHCLHLCSRSLYQDDRAHLWMREAARHVIPTPPHWHCWLLRDHRQLWPQAEENERFTWSSIGRWTNRIATQICCAFHINYSNSCWQWQKYKSTVKQLPAFSENKSLWLCWKISSTVKMVNLSYCKCSYQIKSLTLIKHFPDYINAFVSGCISLCHQVIMIWWQSTFQLYSIIFHTLYSPSVDSISGFLSRSFPVFSSSKK